MLLNFLSSSNKRESYILLGLVRYQWYYSKISDFQNGQFFSSSYVYCTIRNGITMFKQAARKPLWFACFHLENPNASNQKLINTMLASHVVQHGPKFGPAEPGQSGKCMKVQPKMHLIFMSLVHGWVCIYVFIVRTRLGV